MSDILRRIITRFEAQPGNVRAVLGGVGTAYSDAAGRANRLAREQSYLNNQLRAFSTTARYAIAGGVVFGATGAVSTLAQIQTQLGQISALSGLAGVRGPGGASIALVGDSLDQMSSDVRNASIRVVQPVSAINEAILNLMSTSQGLKQNEIVPIVEEMAKGATLAQTPIDQLTQAAASMNVAFQTPPSLANFRKFSREWFTLIGLAPGVRAAGPQILTQFAPLAALMRQGRGTQEQMMALTLGGVRFGGSPSTALRGLQFLVQSIQTPSKQGAKALAQIGVTPESVQSEGIWNSLMTVLRYVRNSTKGISHQQLRNIGGMTDEQLDDVDPSKLPPSLVSGPAAVWLRNALGRIHAVRAAIILAQQIEPHGDVSSLMQDLNKFRDQNNQQLSEYNKGWERFLNRAKLPQAAIALGTLGQDVATAFEPILNLGAKGLTGTSGFFTKHQDLTRGLAISGGIAALLYGGRRLFMRGAGVTALAATGGLTGGEGQWKGMPGDSISNAAYVIVVGTLFSGPGFLGKAGRGATAAEEGALGGAASRSGRAGRFSGFRGSLGRAAAGGIVAAGAFEILNDIINDASGSGGKSMAYVSEHAMGRVSAKQLPHGYALLHDQARRMGGRYKTNQWWLAGPDTHGYLPISSGQATAFSRQLRENPNRPVKLQGKATVDVNMNLKAADGTKTTKKTSVDVQLFSQAIGSPLKAPSSRGQSKTTRG